MRAFKTEINPTKEQIIRINKTMGVCKFIYNMYLSKNQELYSESKKFMPANDFSKWLNNEFIPNNKEYSWIKDVSSKSVKKSMCNAETAYKNSLKKSLNFQDIKRKLTMSKFIFQRIIKQT